MLREGGVVCIAALVLSVWNHPCVDGLIGTSLLRDAYKVSRQRYASRIVERSSSNELQIMCRLKKLTSLSDSSELSQTPQSSYNQTVISDSGEKTARRVLQLIPKVNERLLNNDYSGTIWDAICYEASAISEGDLKAATLMSNFILSQPSFEVAVIDFVANQLETPLVQATTIRNLFADICEKNPQVSSVWALDLMGSAMRDNSQPNAVSVLLFNKGFHSLVTYRIANALWHEGRDGLAVYFQSLISRIFGADIHPACTIGHGCSLSSGTGVVIGETAVIGNDCSISHGVTLGGNGKEKGDRHPKVGNGVHLAAGAIIMGNIRIGDGSVVNAGSVVTKPVAPYTRVGGVPAREIAKFAMNHTYVDELAQLTYVDYTDSNSTADDSIYADLPKSYTDTWGI